MTKKLIKQELPDSDWIADLEYKTVRDVLGWLENFDYDVTLEVGYYGYDGGKRGVMVSKRLETDEEYVTRLAAEAEVKAANKRKEDAKIKADAERMNLLLVDNALLYAFRKKYEGYSKLNDMENLFLAITRLEKDGAPAERIKLVQDCLDGMINN